jgi:hypothetical protein
MDFITGLPQTLKGEDAIVVWVCKLTKLVHLVPFNKKGMDSELLAEMFLREVFRHHGVPSVIVSDRDPKMTSVFWKEVMARLGSKCSFSTAFHPQSDGQTERYNRSLEEIVRHFVSPTMTNWASLLPMAEFALNSHVHKGTRFSPFYLTYGRHPLRPVDLCLDTGATEASVKAEELHAAWNRARQLLVQYAEDMKERTDAKRQDYAFQEGQIVWLSSRNFTWKHGARKLAPKWLGPFTVTEVIGPVAYRLELPEDWKIHSVFHVGLLKEWKGGEYSAPTPSHVRNGVPEWEVDTIVTHRTSGKNKSRKEYLVHWTGFGREWQSWLSEEMLEGSPKLLREYWRTRNINPDIGEVLD